MSDIVAMALARRSAIDRRSTNCFRLVNGASDGYPNLTVDLLAQVLLIQSPKSDLPNTLLTQLRQHFPDTSIYHKILTRHVRQLEPADASPQWLSGPKVDGPFTVRENGIAYQLKLDEGYSIGLFLDQRDNRQHILKLHLAGKTLLNTFAYTCAFSVCAAKAGAISTSIDLSKKYLAWGRENFQLNHLDDQTHDFIYGDVLDWLPRLHKKGRQFDIIILDPPTFSTSKTSGAFSTKKDYPKLLSLAQQCLAPNGAILACMNTHDVSGADFKTLLNIHGPLLPIPLDFPAAPGQEHYLKTAWIHPTH